MSLVKIGIKHQITIPKDILDRLNLESGDLLEATTQEGKIVMIPRILHFTDEEQKILLKVKSKIRV